MTRRTTVDIIPATDAQIEYLKAAGWRNLTTIIRVAIDRMAIQEGYVCTTEAQPTESTGRN